MVPCCKGMGRCIASHGCQYCIMAARKKERKKCPYLPLEYTRVQ